MHLNAETIIRLLDLRPLPQEGGYYSETHRASRLTPESALGSEYIGDRNASTAIYFLITPQEYSALHILPSDEVFHFYLGDPVEMLQLHPDGSANVHTLGTDLLADMRPQVVVPGHTWQGCRLKAGGQFALLGCTVTPGFDFRDFHVATSAEVEQLAARFATHAAIIRELAPRNRQAD
jgi:predicted cupin superfamily sugar epimerase